MYLRALLLRLLVSAVSNYMRVLKLLVSHCMLVFKHKFTQKGKLMLGNRKNVSIA